VLGFFKTIVNAITAIKGAPSAPPPEDAPDQVLDPDAIIRNLGYKAGELKKFQKHYGLKPDGVVGPKTRAVLESLGEAFQDAAPGVLRPFRATHYYVADVSTYANGSFVDVPLQGGAKGPSVPAPFFCAMALEGTGRLRDGTLLNVAGRQYVNVEPTKYEHCAEVYRKHIDYMAKRGRDPRPSRYFGIDYVDGKVTAVQPFRIVPDKERGVGYGTGRKGVPYEPFKTIATDTGAFGKSDSRFKGKGGLVPSGTRVFVLEFVGKECPSIDGGTFIHDGWFVANDTGGGIFGAHFDFFAGSKSIKEQGPSIPPVVHIWFEGIENRIPVGYTHGLYDI
jgi:peptidoglycan hydrolase-like protein with peptidoglycan-binding domain